MSKVKVEAELWYANWVLISSFATCLGICSCLSGGSAALFNWLCSRLSRGSTAAYKRGSTAAYPEDLQPLIKKIYSHLSRGYAAAYQEDLQALIQWFYSRLSKGSTVLTECLQSLHFSIHNLPNYSLILIQGILILIFQDGNGKKNYGT